MTVGELARRTGLSIRSIREYERLGLIYSAGRSEGNYRLFDDVALWCAGAVEQLRALGLTLAEIQELAGVHRAGDERGLEHRLDALLERADKRLEVRIAELTETRQRIWEFQAERPPRPLPSLRGEGLTSRARRPAIACSARSEPPPGSS